MKVAKSFQMKNIDRYAIEEMGIPGMLLMENAAWALTEAVIARITACGSCKVAVICGTGNNGGDGFAAGRQLFTRGVYCRIFVVGHEDSLSGDALLNCKIALRSGVDTVFVDESSIGELSAAVSEAGIVVDAVFGTGLSRDTDDFYGQVFAAINGSGAYIISADIPSGVMGDSGRLCGSFVRANETISFQLPKVGNILYPGAEYNGRLSVCNIGMPVEAVDSESIMCETVESDDVRGIILPRRRDSHKGDYGRIGILAGSPSMAGAAVLNAKAALRCGSGLIKVYVPHSIYAVVEASVTEAMVVGIDTDGENWLKAVDDMLSFADVIATGSGCTNMVNYDEILKNLIKNSEKPVIIDAEGINIISKNPQLITERKGRVTVLTPHAGEMSRLSGRDYGYISQHSIDIAAEYAVENGVYMVLKGPRTITAAPNGRIGINMTGNPGMATAGSGDVLTGMIASLVGQCDDMFRAVSGAVYIHGLAGDIAASQVGEYSLTAGVLTDSIWKAFKTMTGE